MKASDAKRLRELEAKNRKVKQLLGEAQLDKAVRYLVQRGVRSERRACELVGISRSVMRYQAKAKDDDPLRERLQELAVQYPRYGYQTLHPIHRERDG